MTATKAIPEGYHILSPYLMVRTAVDELEFYKKAFGAIESSQLDMPEGKVAHAEFKIGDTKLMISDETRDVLQPPGNVRCQSCNAASIRNRCRCDFRQCHQRGLQVNQGARRLILGRPYGGVVDPFGHYWLIATHVEDVDPSEFKSRMEAGFTEKSA